MELEEAKRRIIEHMSYHRVDVVDLTCSIQQRHGCDWFVPESRQLQDGNWLPILEWSFVSFDPTRWSYAVPTS